MQILDYGSINLIETWGSDEKIIESARMSTNKGFQGWGPIHATNCKLHPDFNNFQSFGETCTCDPKVGDEKLLRYLYKHKHMTPFEMCGAIFEIKAPIFVFREWHRHRTQSYNEMSARYIPLPNEHYTPTEDRYFLNLKSQNKQVQSYSMTDLSKSDVNTWNQQLLDLYKISEQVYQDGLRIGIPKELARLSTLVSRYSKMRASANLRNWMQFLTLRCDQNAQWEIRQYANAVKEYLSRVFPRTIKLFEEELDGKNN